MPLNPVLQMQVVCMLNQRLRHSPPFLQGFGRQGSFLSKKDEEKKFKLQYSRLRSMVHANGKERE